MESFGRALQLAFTTPVPGREREYHDWYDNRHLQEYLAIPGVVAAQRFALNGWQRDGSRPATHTHVAIYELDGNLPDLFARRDEAWNSGRIVPHPEGSIIDDSLVHLWTPITPRLESATTPLSDR